MNSTRFAVTSLSLYDCSIRVLCVVHRKILEGESFGKSLLIKQLMGKNLAISVFICIVEVNLKNCIQNFPPPNFSHVLYYYACQYCKLSYPLS